MLWQATFTFDSPSYFRENQEITVTIPSSITATDTSTTATDYSFYFTTKMFPLYAGPQRVRTELGDLIADVSDDTIFRLLYHNSILSIFYSNDWVNLLRPFVTTRVTGFEAIVIRPAFIVDPVTGAPPAYVTEYVTAKTEADLIKARYLNLMDQLFLAGGPGASKMLADLRISEGGGSLFAATIGPLLVRFYYWEEQMDQYTASSMGTVRSSTESS
jgi:hypothetical protein